MYLRVLLSTFLFTVIQVSGDSMEPNISDGDPCDGYLAIPSVDLELTVFDTWNDSLLGKGACRYYGSYYTNDMIIAGHNYRSLFGKLFKVDIRDSVFFTDMDGNITEYVVKDIEETGGLEISRMIEGDWDLTLYTCTYGRTGRLTVRCDLV